MSVVYCPHRGIAASGHRPLVLPVIRLFRLAGSRSGDSLLADSQEDLDRTDVPGSVPVAQLQLAVPDVPDVPVNRGPGGVLPAATPGAVSATLESRARRVASANPARRAVRRRISQHRRQRSWPTTAQWFTGSGQGFGGVGRLPRVGAQAGSWGAEAQREPQVPARGPGAVTCRSGHWATGSPRPSQPAASTALARRQRPRSTRTPIRASSTSSVQLSAVNRWI